MKEVTEIANFLSNRMVWLSESEKAKKREKLMANNITA